MESYQDIENAIKDYYLMAREIEQLRMELDSIDVSISRYGSLPKGAGPSDGTLPIVIRRDEKKKELAEYESKVNLVEKYSSCISDVREKIVLNCLLENRSVTEIAHYIGVSRMTIYKIKENIIKKMYKSVQNEQKYKIR